MLMITGIYIVVVFLIALSFALLCNTSNEWVFMAVVVTWLSFALILFLTLEEILLVC